MTNLEVFQGCANQWSIQLKDSNGNPVTSYTAADTLSMQLWAGGTQPLLATPTVSWIDPTQGTVQLTIAPTDTEGLLASTYQLALTLTHLSLPILAWRGQLELLEGPGDSTPPAIYCQYADMLALAPQIGAEKHPDQLSGYLTQRGSARAWLDNMILNNSIGKVVMTANNWQGQAFDYYTGRNLYIWQCLHDNLLIQDYAIKTVTAKYAIALVYKPALSPSDKALSQYQKLGNQFEVEANRLSKTIYAQFDINGDGVPDFAVPLSYLSIRGRRWGGGGCV